jgi:hypothetical protein
MISSAVDNILQFMNENIINSTLEIVQVIKKVIEIYFEFADLFPKPFNILIIILIPSMFILFILKLKELII